VSLSSTSIRDEKKTLYKNKDP